MSQNLMKTEPGGESRQYEGDLGLGGPQKKSGGQMGQPETTLDPSKTEEGQQRAAERGAQTTENIRYGQTISEQGGVGGMTHGQEGSGVKEAYGRVEDEVGDSGNVDAAQDRRAQGYGGQKDMDREIGA